MSDYISRQDAVDAIGKSLDRETILLQFVRRLAIGAVKGLPSARVREIAFGKWSGYKAEDPQWRRDDGTPIFLICSECNSTVINNGSAQWNYCPVCGSDNRGK